VADLEYNILNKFKKQKNIISSEKKEKTLPGRVINRGNVKFLESDSVFPHSILIPRKDMFHKHYISSLELLYGIRDKKSEKLAAAGIKDLIQLKASGHKSSSEADYILQALEKDFSSIKEVLSDRFSSSHRLLFLLLSYFNKEDLLFLDIETKSLAFETSILLIGAGYFEKDEFKVKQFTILEDAAEYEILEEFVKTFKDKKAFVTFNGRTFDVPFIDQRLSYYGISSGMDFLTRHNFDLLHFSRNIFKNTQESFRLKQLECDVLGMKRECDIDGAEVEIYYDKYIRTGKPEFLAPIVEHNRTDIESLLLLLNKISGIWAK
jgi:uncharacterized protein YprB with RNaseH-like and TPR domain